MADSPRIIELRRRVQQDPASVLFAQLAEEHRRAGDLDEAVRICRSGLARHPEYVAARVTLGRALAELGSDTAAAQELDEALRRAPDNLAATRALAALRSDAVAERRVPPGPPAQHAVSPSSTDTPDSSDRTSDPVEESAPPVVEVASPHAIAAEPTGVASAAVSAGDPFAQERSAPTPQRARLTAAADALDRWRTAIRADRQVRSTMRRLPDAVSPDPSSAAGLH